eukprot:438564-Pyramimonas_sp.AAC.1
MERLTVAHPALSERLWIDDLSQTAEGSSQFVRESFIEGVPAVHDMLEDEGLQLAPKSASMCSSMQDAKAIVRELSRRG